MLSKIESEVCQRLGIAPEDFETTKTSGTRTARNSDGGDSLTAEQRQVCERCGLDELEFMEVLTSDGQSDPVVKAMIDALMPTTTACCRSYEVSPEETGKAFGPILGL